jgi:putative endonuclease
VSKERLQLGKQGEESAVILLKKNGYKILARNYKTKLGEIDVIALDKGTLCFVEVKTRSSDRFGAPAEAVSGFKQRQISKAALCYLKEKKLLERKARFDVVCVVYSREKPQPELIKDAFELDSGYTY